MPVLTSAPLCLRLYADDLYSVMRGLMVPVMDRLKSEFDLVATSAESVL